MKSFIEFQKEEVELDEAADKHGYDSSSASHKKVMGMTTGHSYSPDSTAEYHSDGSASIHHSKTSPSNTNSGVSSATKADNNLKNAGGMHGHSERSLSNHKQTIKGLKYHVKKTATGHTVHISEEVELDEEQLDELSKDTLVSYEKKSRVAAHKHALASELKGLAADPAGSYAHKMMADKRHAGWKVAVKKLNTEETDLDEAFIAPALSAANANAEFARRNSHGILKIDIKHLGGVKDHKSITSHLDSKGVKADVGTNGGNIVHLSALSQSHSEIKKKLGIKEEVDLDEEQLDELSKKTLGSYVNKAAKDTGRLGMVLHKGEWIHTVTTQPNRVKGIATAVGKLTKEESDTPFDGPYKQSKGTVTDKSGAKHTPLSNVRSLARNAIEKMKQKMRMAHLSPEVRAEKLARNEELVGGQKKLDIDKDGKIEKSDLETIRTKKLKEDVTTAAQRLKAALDRHTEKAVAANRAGDHDAVKVHQGYANKIKTQLGKLAKNEEVEIDEASRAKLTNYISAAKSDEKKDRSVGIALAQKKKWGDEKHGTVSAKVPANEGHQVVATTKEGETFKSGIHSTKEKALGQHYKMAKSGNFKKIATLKTEEVEQIEERNKQNAMMRKTMDASRGARYKLNNPVPDAEPEHKTAQAHNKAIGRALRSEDTMTDAEMANREKIVKGMKKSFKDFTAKYGDRAKEVMYATATKKAMEEEVEEELEEDMDEGVTTRNGAVTVHKGTYGTSYQGDDEDDENDTPEKKEPAVKRGRGRPAGAKSGAKPKGSSAGKSYGGLTIHSLRLPKVD
jgi:hypothetical protein